MDHHKELRDAIEAADLKKTMELLVNKINLNKKIPPTGFLSGSFDETLLHFAVKSGSLPITRLLIERGARVNATTSGKYASKATPLHYAARSGHDDIAKLLIDNGAHLFVLTKYGYSVFDNACEGDMKWLVELLLQKGVVIDDYKGKEGKVGPLNLVARNGHQELYQYLLDQGATIKDKKSLLADACKGGFTSLVEELLRDVKSINTSIEEGETVLHRAASGKDTVEVVKLLLKRGAKVNSQVQSGYDKGMTPLHYTAEMENLEVAKLLIEHGAAVNISSEYHGSPLEYTAYKKRLSLMLLLIQNGADIDKPIQLSIYIENDRFETKTLLIWAVVGDYPELVAVLIENGSDVNKHNKHSTDSFGDTDERTALHYAAQLGREDMVKMLIDANSDLDRTDFYGGYTPLMLAARENQLVVAKMLIAAGANLDIQDKDEKTLLHHAAYGNMSWLVTCLIQKNADINAKAGVCDETPLEEALFFGNAEAAKLLIESGAEIDKPNSIGDYPIYYAGGINGELVVMLAQRGADINRRNKNGETPLHRAAFRGKEDAALALLKRGAMLDLVDEYNQTPLHIAASKGHHEVVKLLVEYGANTTLRSEKYEHDSMTPLERAQANGNQSIVDYLKKVSGLSFEEIALQKRQHLEQCFIEAVTSGDELEAQRCLNQGEIDVGVKNNSEQTALHIAVLKDDEKMVNMLLCYGADPTVKDAKGRTAIELASGKTTIKKRLKEPSKIKQEVQTFVRLLRSGSSTEKISEAAAILMKDKDLWPAVTTGEIKRLRSSGDREIEKLADDIEKKVEDIFDYNKCEQCGRDTLIRLEMKVTHGNPHTPASDTEVCWSSQCASCDHSQNIYV